MYTAGKSGKKQIRFGGPRNLGGATGARARKRKQREELEQKEKRRGGEPDCIEDVREAYVFRM